MKIKTIWRKNPRSFDEEVNEEIEKGYQLVRREVLVDTNCLGDSVFYAELIKQDPAPDPEPVERYAIQALHIVKDACLSHQGPCNDCPMTEWCERLAYGGDPTDWELPELED